MAFLDLIGAVISFLNVGFFSGIVSRFTGANMTVLILASLLYLGGRPIEIVGIMMTYLVFMRLTMYTQDHRINYKELKIFNGWKLWLLGILVLLCLLIYPFAALALFLAFFLTELMARVYEETDPKDRLPVSTLATYACIAGAITTACFAATMLIPEEFYYGIAAAAILAVAAFFWWIGQDRKRLAGCWDTVIMGSFIPAGLFGLDLSDWLDDMRRYGKQSKLAKSLPFIYLPAFYIAFIAGNVFFGIFSFSGLILTFFSALSIRLFGYYQMSGKGKTNLVSLAVVILAAVCLLLTAPTPTGISEVIDVYLPSQPAIDVWELIK